jgi:multidrug efflux pump subunit AcrA (membrane-fusion protein)
MNDQTDNRTAPAGNDKRSSSLLKVLPIAVLAAVLLYFAAQVYNYFADPLTITMVYESQAEDTLSMDGWLVRTEEPLPGQSGTVSRAVQEGQRVAAGETVATVYSDDSALQTVSRIETLELQLQQLEFALTSYLDPDAALKLDTSITDDILALRQTLIQGDYASAESDLATLKAAVLKRDYGAYESQEAIQSQVKTVENELTQLRASLSGAGTVRAKASGTYSAVCDGYESVLTEEFLKDVTPSRLKSLKAGTAESNVGKLIYGDTWYYAVTLPADQAAELKTMGRVSVRLAKGFDQSIRMTVESVSREENGEAVVVLSSTRYLAQTTLLRHQAADAVLHTYQGLRVPANALRVSEDGTTGVYCVDGENASFRPVTLVYQGAGYALVTPADGVADTRTLRAGDQVIATSGELHDGKVIR